MRKVMSAALGLCVLLTAVSALRAEGEKRASPHETVSATVGGKKVSITYGRPSKKGRVIFGELVPLKEVWRTGADEATTLTTDGDLTIGALKVPKGTYALFTIPAEKEWTLVVNKVSKQWGAFKYDQKQDLGRVPMKVAESPAPVEMFTIALEPQGPKGGTLKLSWDKTVASVAVSAP